MDVRGYLPDFPRRISLIVSSRRLTIAALVVLGCFPAVLLWQVTASNRIPLPFWDEWFTPGSLLYSWCNGTLGLGDWFIPHNESRKFFPRLLYWLLAQLHGWDVRDAMLLVFAEVCVLTLLLWRLLRQTAGVAPVAAVTTWVVMAFLCFSPVQFENFLWGIQLETFFPGVAVAAAAMVNLSRFSLPVRTVCNALLALVATYTYANGMLLWVLAVPLPEAKATRRTMLLCFAAYLIAGVSTVASYFHGYHRPEDLPPIALAGRHPADLIRYAVLWVGAYFRSDFVDAFTAGLCALLLGFFTFAAAAVTAVRSGNWRSFYPWFLMTAYAAVSCAIIAVGRLPLGIEHAMDSRYTAFSLFYYLGWAGCCYALYVVALHDAGPQRRLILGSVAVLMAVALLAWGACYHTGLKHLETRRAERLTLSYALEWMNVIPDNPDIRAIFPTPQWLFDTIPVLRRCGILRIPFVAEPLATLVTRVPSETDGSHGGIDACRFDTAGKLVISGWAWLPRQKRPADRVIIGYEDAAGMFKPVSVIGTGVSRPDLRDHFRQSKMLEAGFARTMDAANIPAGPVTISAWAIDLQKQRAYPLGGRHRPPREAKR